MEQTMQIHPDDNVAVVLPPMDGAVRPPFRDSASHLVEAGHKIALQPLKQGETILKYGMPIGRTTCDIPRYGWVHSHNMVTNLGDETELRYRPRIPPVPPLVHREFSGYQREDGRVAVRNELWILPLTGCVNPTAQRLAEQNQGLVQGSIDGVYAFPHPYGCSQMGEDHGNTRAILAALAGHPNAGAVLLVGLGCENLTFDQMKESLGDYDPRRVAFLHCQDAEDELCEGGRLLQNLADYAAAFRRQTLSADGLVVGLKCGGSDGFSGITANPVVGAFSDALLQSGGSALLTEVPEMFGAEDILFRRCANEDIFRKAAAMTADFKDYYRRHGQTVYENPSPGNKAGGITTLEEKSCGCVQKGGTMPICDVISYGGTVQKRGLTLLSGPGNDLVSATALTAAGAHMVLFTTGRGTPFGAPVPTIKIASNEALFRRKPGWMDFNAATVLGGESMGDAGERLLSYVLRIAGGERTAAERNGFREMAVWKNGVTL